MELNDLRLDLARRQKKGLHFILASVFIWTLIQVVALVLGVLLPRFALAIFMVVVEVVFACCLHQECKKL